MIVDGCRPIHTMSYTLVYTLADRQNGLTKDGGFTIKAKLASHTQFTFKFINSADRQTAVAEGLSLNGENGAIQLVVFVVRLSN